MTNDPEQPPEWVGRSAVFATMHGKETVVAPCLSAGLGLIVVVPPHFNSDRFGTFTGEIARVGTQWEAARAKAEAAMAESGYDVGIASEGSFAPDPHLPFVTRNRELVLLVDKQLKREIAGWYETTASLAAGQMVNSVAEARAVAERWGFPTQGVIVRETRTGTTHLMKDSLDWESFESAVETCLREAGACYLETDLRAHRHATRREAIRRATDDLVRTCRRRCPQCQSPGFQVERLVSGLPCAACGSPTALPLQAVYVCGHCGYTADGPLPLPGPEMADPGQCGACNP